MKNSSKNKDCRWIESKDYVYFSIIFIYFSNVADASGISALIFKGFHKAQHKHNSK